MDGFRGQQGGRGLYRQPHVSHLVLRRLSASAVAMEGRSASGRGPRHLDRAGGAGIRERGVLSLATGDYRLPDRPRGHRIAAGHGHSYPCQGPEPVYGGGRPRLGALRRVRDSFGILRPVPDRRLAQTGDRPVGETGVQAWRGVRLAPRPAYARPVAAAHRPAGLVRLCLHAYRPGQRRLRHRLSALPPLVLWVYGRLSALDRESTGLLAFPDRPLSALLVRRGGLGRC